MSGIHTKLGETISAVREGMRNLVYRSLAVGIISGLWVFAWFRAEPPNPALPADPLLAQLTSDTTNSPEDAPADAWAQAFFDLQIRNWFRSST